MTIHNQLQQMTNCDQLLLPQVHLMVSILFFNTRSWKELRNRQAEQGACCVLCRCLISLPFRFWNQCPHLVLGIKQGGKNPLSSAMMKLVIPATPDDDDGGGWWGDRIWDRLRCGYLACRKWLSFALDLNHPPGHQGRRRLKRKLRRLTNCLGRWTQCWGCNAPLRRGIEYVRSRVKKPPCGRFENDGGVPDNFLANLFMRGLWQASKIMQVLQKFTTVVPDKTPLNLK